MPTGAFFTSLNYRFWVAAGTTASTAPANNTGLTEVLSVTNVGIQGSTDTQDVLDYGTDLGFKATLVTGQSYTIPMTLNLNLRDAGYQILKNAALNATTQTVRWYRESPEMSAAGLPERHAGVAFVTDFSESIEAGGVAQVSFTLQGYGAYTFTAETDVDPT
jgi:hypothetical protein